MSLLRYWVAGLLIALLAAGCDGGGGSSKSTSSNEEPTYLGSLANPRTVPVGTSTVQVLSAGNSAYGGDLGTLTFFKFTAQGAGHYTIALEKDAPDISTLGWVLSDDASWDTFLDYCDYGDPDVTNSCLTYLLQAGTTYYLASLNTWYLNRSATLTIANVGAPTSLTAGSNGPYMMSRYGTLYLSFTTGSSSTAFTIDAVRSGYGISDLAWLLFTSPTYASGFVQSCDVQDEYGTGESCNTSMLSPNTTYYLAILEYVPNYGGVSVTLTVLP